jgi:uncharacterized protein (TIGR00369 family)
MENMDNYTQLPVRDGYKCFACGPANPSGLHMRFFANEDEVVSWVTIPDHLRGWSNLVHGGIISTLLDEIMSWAAIHLLQKIIVTKTMTVDFIKPIYIGQKLKAQGRTVEMSGRNEAIMEGHLHNEQGELCAKARGHFALLKPKVAVRLGLVDAEDLKNLLNDASV